MPGAAPDSTEPAQWGSAMIGIREAWLWLTRAEIQVKPPQEMLLVWPSPGGGLQGSAKLKQRWCCSRACLPEKLGHMRWGPVHPMTPEMSLVLAGCSWVQHGRAETPRHTVACECGA